MRRRFTSNKGGDTFDINNYLTIEALEDGLQFIFYQAVEYGIDGTGWKLLNANESSPAIKAGQTISIRAWLSDAALDHLGFRITKECNLKGNCLSLLFGNDAADELDLSGKDNCFRFLFYNCNTIKSVSIDFLPATTLADSCYHSMFSHCSNLTTAPALPATTLADSCYNSMFYGCGKLNYIKMLATDISPRFCLIDWVANVSSTGTFVKSKDATWNLTGKSGVPSGWTVIRA